jgi:hypothetical protein
VADNHLAERRVLRQTEGFFDGKSPGLTLLLGAAFLAVVAVMDYLLGPRLSVALFYLMPIGLVTWNLGLRWGATTVALSTLAALWSDLLYPQFDLLPWWNAIFRFAAFLSVAVLLGTLRRIIAAQWTHLEREAAVASGDIVILGDDSVGIANVDIPAGAWGAGRGHRYLRAAPPARPRFTAPAVGWADFAVLREDVATPQETARFALALVVSQQSIDQIWTWFTDQSLLLQVPLGILFLPWVVGMWIWESSWPLVARGALVGGEAEALQFADMVALDEDRAGGADFGVEHGVFPEAADKDGSPAINEAFRQSFMQRIRQPVLDLARFFLPVCRIGQPAGSVRDESPGPDLRDPRRQRVDLTLGRRGALHLLGPQENPQWTGNPDLAMAAVITAHGRSLFPVEYVGRGLTFLNLGTMGGVFTLQTLTGLVVGLFDAPGGVYPVEAYQAAFGFLAVVLGAASLVYFVTANDPARSAARAP